MPLIFESLLRVETTVLRRAATTVGSATLSAGWRLNEHTDSIFFQEYSLPREVSVRRFPPPTFRALLRCNRITNRRTYETRHRSDQKRRATTEEVEQAPELSILVNRKK